MKDFRTPATSGGEHRPPDPVLDELAEHPVLVRKPDQLGVPVIFASPHSGRVYPPSFLHQSRLDALSLRKSEDAFVDELFLAVADFGAPLLAARFPRAFVDANRAASELDPAMFNTPLSLQVGPRTARVAAGLGVIPRVVKDGLDIYSGRLPGAEAAFRLQRFHQPYHDALSALIAEAKAQFGMAVVVDCHSMPPPARGSDIVIGDCYGEAAASELSSEAQAILTGLGFAVARNTPYAGGYTTHRYGRPLEGVHALQIEISRALYLDEARIEKTARFVECRERLSLFAAKLTRAALSFLSASLPRAAE